ncbi:PAS domain S-box protein [Desulfogranum japonicum]|uniref:PAS domain S-box protein n=1 Tax=Desulfogranum japonicum TaxID=231447 RepID=UPI0003F9449D|nr:PAS domain S-box protein [Desulfogranum japonicum]
MSFRNKLIFGVALIHAMLMSLFILDLTWRQKRMFYEHQAEHTISLAHTLVTSSAGWLAAKDYSGLQEIVTIQEHYPDLDFAMLTDLSGKILAHTDSSKIGLKVLNMPVTPEADPVHMSSSLVDVTLPVMLNNSQVGWARVGIGRQRSMQEIQRIVHEGILYTLVAIISGILIAWLIAGNLTKRLYAIQKTIDQVKNEDPETRINVSGNDEVTGLAREFNAMLDALAERELELRKMNASLENEVDSRTKMLEESLTLVEQREKELETAQHVAKIGSWALDLVDNVSTWSKEIHAIFGLAKDVSPSLDLVFSCTHPDDLQQVKTSWFEALAGSPYDLEHRIIVNGQVKWVHARAEIEFDAQGAPLLAIGTVQDITELKKNMLALSHSEQRMRALIDASPIPILLYNLQEQVDYLNPAFIQMFGYTADEIPTMTAWMEKAFPDPVYREKVTSESFTQPEHGQNNKSTVLERQIYCKDGSLRVVQMNRTRLDSPDETLYLVTFFDVTQIKNISTRLQTLLDTATDGIHVLDESGKVVQFSHSFARMLGYAPDELHGLSVLDWEAVIPSDELRVWMNRFHDEAEAFETRYRRKDGILIDVEINAKSIELEGKKYLYASARDISERKSAETRLQQLATIVESSDDAIFSESLEGIITSWNKGAEVLFGYTEDEAMGESVAILLPDADLAEELRILALIAEGQSLTHYQAQRVRKDGKTVTVSLTISPLYDTDGDIIGASKIVRDITRLKESEERFHTLFMHSPDAMLIVELHDRIIVDCNRAAETILRGDRNQIIGESPNRFCPKYQANDSPSANAASEKMAQAMEAGTNRYEWMHKRFNGEIFWADVSIAPIVMEGERVLLVAWRDITDQKEIALQLRSTLDRLEMATRAAAMGIWVWDVTRNTLVWDERMFDLYRVPEKERQKILSYEFWLERIHPEDTAMAEQQLVEQFHSKESKDFVFRIVLPDKQIRYIKTAVYPEYDEHGRLIRVVGTSRDVTTARINEQKLAESESQFRQLFERNHSVMLLIDPDTGAILAANQAAINFYQYPEDILTGLSINDINILPKELVDKERERAKAEQTNYFLFKHKLASGEIRDVEVYVTPISVKGAVKLFSIIHDVTDRRLAQNALEEANRKSARHGALLQHVLDTASVAILLVNRQSVITLANKRAAEMFARPLDSMIGLDYPILVHPSQRHASNQTLFAICNLELVTVDLERLYLRTDGTEFWGQLNVRLFSSSAGDENQVVISIADITQYKEAQHQLIRAKEEAEAASRHKSEFLANMSHEIRTPLNGVIGLTHLMQNTELSPKQQDYIAKIDSSSKALLHVLNDILDYSKIEAGYLHLEPDAFYIDDLLKSISDLFSILAEEKGLVFLFDVASDVPQYLEGDQLRLLQVLSNLVGNAIKFTTHGEIRVAIARVASSGDEIWLKFSVQDTGIGISSENQEKLFQAFQQADGSTTRQFGGTGLGLSISKKIVELMGGQIGIQSEGGKGSTFHFSVPLRARHDIPFYRDPARLRGMRILLVDSQDSSRQVLRQILDSWDFEVTEAVSAAECQAEIDKAILEQHPYELLIVDWNFQGMNGFEIVRLARNAYEQAGIGYLPAIVPVNSMGRELARSMQEGVHADVLIDKPHTSSQLFDVIIDLQQRNSCTVRGLSQESTTKDPGRSYMFAGARVLLVEDNKVNQQVAGELLQSLGLHVTTADNGQEALECIDAENYDAILLDLQMPVMDGYETTRHIRALKHQQNLPVIAMTAAALIQDKEACLAAGMNDHIAKPIDPEALITTLTKWITPSGGQHVENDVVSLQPDYGTGSPFELPGFDLQSAVQRMGGSWTALRKALHVFTSEFRQIKPVIHDNIEQSQYRQAAKHIHTIKGAAGNIGAISLHNSAAEFEQNLKSDSSTGWKQFEKVYDETMACLERLDENMHEAQNGIGEQKHNVEEVQQRLADLRTILQQQRIVPETLLQEVRAMLSGRKIDVLVKRLQRQIDGFEYPEAVETIATIKQKLQPAAHI